MTTEAEWLASSDPRAMLDYLCGSKGYGMALSTGRASSLTIDRKLRLFAAAINPVWDQWAKLDNLGVIDWLATLSSHLSAAGNVAPLLRDIIGNPFRPVTRESIGMDGWYGNSLANVEGIAERIYQDRAFDDMPILADALEEAGCTDEAILRHCRGVPCHICKAGTVQGNFRCAFCKGEGWIGRGPHVRGCWVVDLILGKE